jgi:pyroglutamyl-peptidase
MQLPMPDPGLVLVTGFDAFGGDTHNSSWLLAQALDGLDLGGTRVRAAQLPTRFSATDAALRALVAAVPPQRLRAVLALGQAASRAALSFERVAVNWIDARIPDNEGAQPLDRPVLPGAAAARFTTLPIKTMVAAARAEGVPAEVSYTAGSFVCNQAFYLLQHRLRRRRGVASGFVHVPALPGPLALEDMVRGLQAGLKALLELPPAADLDTEGRLD